MTVFIALVGQMASIKAAEISYHAVLSNVINPPNDFIYIITCVYVCLHVADTFIQLRPY